MAFEACAESPPDVTLWTRPWIAIARFSDAHPTWRPDKGFVGGQRAGRPPARCAVWYCPHAGGKAPARHTHERQRWFRRGQRWRTSCEGRISVLNAAMACSAVAIMGTIGCIDVSGSASPLTTGSTSAPTWIGSPRGNCPAANRATLAGLGRFAAGRRASRK